MPPLLKLFNWRFSMAHELNVFGVIAIILFVAAALEWLWNKQNAARAKAEREASIQEVESMISRAKAAGLKVTERGDKVEFKEGQ
jgi:hypothetical protein